MTVSSNINNSYATGSVSGVTKVAGLVAYHRFSDINNSYATGYLSGENEVGGLIGYSYDSFVYNSFWDIGTSGVAISDGGTGKTTAEMKDVTIYTDIMTSGLDIPWDFVGNPNDDSNNDDFWDIDDIEINDGYPFLTSLGSSIPPNAPTNLVISIVGNDVHLFWDGMDDVTYKIYRSIEPHAEDWGENIGSAETNSYIDENGCIEGNIYFYYVTVIN